MLFVSTTLKSLELDDLRGNPHDLDHDGIAYRLLDPDYYAWLRHRLGVAEKAMQKGKLPTSALNQMRVRFSSLHDWAVEQYGKPSLLDSIRRLNPDAYDPPSMNRMLQEKVQQDSTSPVPHLYPAEGIRPFTESINHDAVKQVDAIRDKALNLGWSEPRLYQNRGRFRFPCGPDYGLVCFLHDGQTIGEVSEKHIELIGAPPNCNILRFYNPDVDQPWIRKIEPEKQTTELAA